MRTRQRGRGRTTGPVRLGARLAVVAGVLVVAVSALAPAAGAAFPQVEAAVGCDRIVTWRASASSEGSDEERTNTSVAVEFRSTADQPWRPAGPTGAFLAEDDFTFTGTFALPEGTDAVELRVRTLVPWGSDQQGDPAGDERFAAAELPGSCARAPLAVRQQLDCAAGAVTVRAEDVGGRATAASVLVDRIEVRRLEIAAGGSAELVVPVLAGRPARIQVRVGDDVISEQVHGADCAPDGPLAVVLERCGAPAGRLVVLAASPDASLPAEIRVDGSTVETARAEPGVELRRTLDLPPGERSVEVLLGDRVVASGRTGACTGAVAGVLGCGTGSRPACGATVPPTSAPVPGPPPPLPPETGGALPHTGPAQRALGLLIGGVLLAGGGVALGARDRRRVLPSALGEAIAPYRQRWWDEP